MLPHTSLFVGLHLFSRQLDSAASLTEGARYHLKRTLVNMYLQLAPLQPLSLALVWAVHGELETHWEVLLCDEIVCTVVATVLAGGWSLATVTFRMHLHHAALNLLTTVEGA